MSDNKENENGVLVETVDLLKHYKGGEIKALDGVCSVSFVRTVATKLESENDEEYLLVGEGSVINIDEAISEELLLSLPFSCPRAGCPSSTVPASQNPCS